MGQLQYSKKGNFLSQFSLQHMLDQSRETGSVEVIYVIEAGVMK